MKKNRYIPYGYTMKNGKLVIEKSEADVIRRIYENYINGSSLKDIAEDLTEKKIPYSEKMTGWGKARVARIIENAKYLGNEEYDKIIDDSVYYKAIAAKSARQTYIPGDLHNEISFVKDKIQCAECGYPMTREYDKRLKIKTTWICTNANCGCRCKIEDADLLEKVMRIIKRIKDNEALLDMKPEDKKLTDTAVKLTETFQKELESGNADDDKLLNLIMAIANEEYRNADTEAEVAAANIKHKIRRIEIHEEFNYELTDLLVKNIRLGEDLVEIVTHNNINIGEDNGS